MRLVSARRTRSPADGQSVAPVPAHPVIKRTASTYIFGAVCPKEGKGAALILPACNTEAMNLHLAEIATIIAPGVPAVLLVDRLAGTCRRASSCRPTSPLSPCRQNAPSSWPDGYFVPARLRDYCICA